MKKILSLMLVICFLLIPFSIYSDASYYEISSNTQTLLYHYRSYNNRYQYLKADKNVRLVRLLNKYSSTSIFYVISQSTFNYSLLQGYDDTVISNLNNTSSNYNRNNYNFYYINFNAPNGFDTDTYYVKDVDIPYYELDTYYDNNGLYELAYDYTYGNLATDTIIYGNLNIRFNTDISTHDAGENQDNILWTAWDSNGNYIGDKQIEIRAVPGYYEAQDKPSLLQLKFINWVRESNLEVQVFKGSVIPEHKTYTWNYIAGLFSSIKTWQGRFWSIFASDEYWYQYGWIYEARILDTDDTPLSEWQEIVTGTASSPKDTEIIETSDELTPELYNVIYNINVYNDYQENWQINNTTINMQPDETLENDKPWWVVLLEGILSILDKLLELLMKLFIPENLTLPDFTNQTNQYMNNTGIFGQSIQFINDTHTTFQSIQNADPVISVPAITYDNTTLIPAQSWNLNTLVDDYGLSNLHNMVYLVTDGFVYIGLIILIRRKVIEVLKK